MCIRDSTNSFQRLGEFEAPKYITWSHQNSRPLITVPLSEDSTAHRFKLRAFDGCINPYIVFALLIHAGLDGIEQGLPLPPACDENLFTASDEVRARYETLPGALCEMCIRDSSSSVFTPESVSMVMVVRPSVMPLSYRYLPTQRMPLPHIFPSEPSALKIRICASALSEGEIRIMPSPPIPKCGSLSLIESDSGSGTV